MKKLLSVFLSLLMVLACFTGCANAASQYTIPKTVSTVENSTKQKGTVNFSVIGDTLFETANLPDADVSGITEYAELAFLPGNADLNQQLIAIDRAMTDYPCYPSALIWSPLLTSGKIKKVTVKLSFTYNGKTISNDTNTFIVTAQNGYVTKFGDETYSYDAQGNLIRQKLQDGATITYSYDSNGHLIRTKSSKAIEPGDPSTTYKWNGNVVKETGMGTVYNISNGKIIKGGTEDFNEFYNVKRKSDGTFKCYNYYFAEHSVVYQNLYI